MPRLSDYVSFNNDFKNSINLYLDINKAEKVKSYIPTKSSVEVLKLYLESIVYNKMQATLLIGPYGKGKSHLLLLILAIVSLDRRITENNILINDLAARVGKVDVNVQELILKTWAKKRFLPVLIMSTHEDLNRAFMVALNDALKREGMTSLSPNTFYSYALDTITLWKNRYKETYTNYLRLLSENKYSENEMAAGLRSCDKNSLNVFKTIYPQLTSGGIFNPLVNSEVLPMYSNINDKLVEEYNYSGMFLIFDEFSKYIESLDKKASGSNMKLLQDICELANASKQSQIFFSMVAHKSIKEYGKYLSNEIINSFTGIEGRIKEIYFVTSSKNNYELVQNAIYKNEGFDKEPIINKRFDSSIVDDFYQLGSFSSEFTRSDFERIVVKGCYPLSPTSVYLLLNISEKVAQNERTLFTFISKDEPNSMVRYINTIADESGTNWVIGAPLIYDYFQTLFKKEVNNTFIHNIWLQAEYAISQIKEPEQIAMIKTLAIITIVNKPDEMPADRTSLLLASEVKDPDTAITNLINEDIIYKKESNNCFVFKTRATSELKSEITRRKHLKAGKTNFNEILSKVSDIHYVLPKRYNYEYKMTRYFRYEYISVDEFLSLKNINAVLSDGKLNDGKFLVLYSDNDANYSSIIIEKMLSNKVDNIAVIYANKPCKVTEQIIEYDVIQDIKNDKVFFSKEENKILEREIPIIEEELERIIGDFLEEAYGYSSSKKIFFFDNDKLSCVENIPLSDVADKICFSLFNETVRVNNELINKEVISTAPIRKARKTLIDQMIRKQDMSVYLNGTSAEATIYRALFVGTGIVKGDIEQNALSALNIISNFIDSTANGKKKLSSLINKLVEAPIGMRKGIIPLFLAYVLSSRTEDIVVYFNDKEIQIDSEIILNMCEAPNDYYIFISADDVDKEVYLTELTKLFDVKESKNKSESRIHNIVIAMQRWYRALPQITKNLKKKNEYWANEKIGNAYPIFKEIMQKIDINPYEALFSIIPSAFQCDNNFKQLIADLTLLKQKLAEYYRWMIERTIEATLKVFNAKVNLELNHVLDEWYESQSDIAKHGLHSTRVTKLMSCIAENTSFDSGDLVKKVVKAVTDIYMDSWNENSLEQYIHELKEVKEEVEALGVENRLGIDNHVLSYIGKNGDPIVCYYKHVDEGTGAILRNILSDTLDDFPNLTVNEKVAILLEMISKELGK